tara:strand:+ start:198 stop:476 length:279 start_codon:yes stop_codon:yes gene_type:complete
MIKKILLSVSILFCLAVGLTVKANADTSLGEGAVYKSCIKNIKAMNIYREDIAYNQIFLKDTHGYLTCNGSRVVKKGYSVSKEISDVFYLNF